jgi:hypothetical protein
MDVTQNPADPKTSAQPPDWTVPILIAVLGGLEILVLGILFFAETPLSPLARRAAESISGTMTLVASILFVLCLATAAFWAIVNKYKSHERKRAV